MHDNTPCRAISAQPLLPAGRNVLQGWPAAMARFFASSRLTSASISSLYCDSNISHLNSASSSSLAPICRLSHPSPTPPATPGPSPCELAEWRHHTGHPSPRYPGRCHAEPLPWPGRLFINSINAPNSSSSGIVMTLLAAAFFILLATATGAGIVATDFRSYQGFFRTHDLACLRNS